MAYFKLRDFSYPFHSDDIMDRTSGNMIWGCSVELDDEFVLNEIGISPEELRSYIAEKPSVDVFYDNGVKFMGDVHLRPMAEPPPGEFRGEVRFILKGKAEPDLIIREMREEVPKKVLHIKRVGEIRNARIVVDRVERINESDYYRISVKVDALSNLSCLNRGFNNCEFEPSGSNRRISLQLLGRFYEENPVADMIALEFEGRDVEIGRARSHLLQHFRHMNLTVEESPQSTKAEEKAMRLLRRFLTKEQDEQLTKIHLFRFTDSKHRDWTFYDRFHWPVGVSIKGKNVTLCFQTDPKVPTCDLLLQAYLEVKGGNGDRLIKIGTERSIRPYPMGFQQAMVNAAVSVNEMQEGMRRMSEAMLRSTVNARELNEALIPEREANDETP